MTLSRPQYNGNLTKGNAGFGASRLFSSQARVAFVLRSPRGATQDLDGAGLTPSEGSSTRPAQCWAGRYLRASANSQAIVQAILSLGASFGMKVIAEGIEHAEDVAYLRSAGCQEGQGYFFSKPKPSCELFPLAAATEPKTSNSVIRSDFKSTDQLGKKVTEARSLRQLTTKRER